jgi:signal transduction histidine kinase
MRVSIRTKQVAGVTAIVGLTVILLAGWYLLSLASVLLTERQAKAEMIVKTIFQRAAAVASEGGDLAGALATDGGLRSILEGSLYGGDIAYAAIVDTNGLVITHWDATMIGERLPQATELNTVMALGPFERAQTLFTPGMLEVREDLILDGQPFGSIHVGFSTLLIRNKFEETQVTTLVTAGIALAAAVLVATLLANMVVRPIHVIQSRLARLGRGEIDAPELPSGEELGDLEDSFKAVISRIHSDRSRLEGRTAALASVAEQLEDGVALFGTGGALRFANTVMRPIVGEDDELIGDRLPPDHPYRVAVERALAGHVTTEPETVQLPGGGSRQITTQAVSDDKGQPIGVMLVARDLAYLSEVESTLSYSRKLAALSRLSAGIAHEIKNPLNAMMIHLELLKLRLVGQPDASQHVAVINAQLRRLDEVVQGFLKFSRPEELKLQPVRLAGLFDDLMPILEAEASKSQVVVHLDVPADLAPVAGDRPMLEQAFLNLGLNACQAMPNGGRLDITARELPQRRIEVRFEDTGTGISPADLSRVFDLYFTTRETGSGIGLSLVYRTIQLHDGEVDVESTPGHGTTFRLVLRRAEVPASVLPISTS